MDPGKCRVLGDGPGTCDCREIRGRGLNRVHTKMKGPGGFGSVTTLKEEPWSGVKVYGRTESSQSLGHRRF